MTTSIPPNSIFQPRVTSSGSKGSSSTFRDEVRSVGRFGSHLGLTAGGSVLMLIFGALKSLVPNKFTFLEDFSLVGVIGGAIMTAFGVLGLYKGGKVKKERVPNEIPRLTIPDSTGGFKYNCQRLEGIIKGLDTRFSKPYDPANPGLILSSNVTDSTLQNDVPNLLMQYTEKEVPAVISAYSGEEPMITNVSAEEILLSEFQSRVAGLLTYTSIVNQVLTSPSNLVIQRMGEILQNTEIGKDYIDLLPPGFADVYKLAKIYQNNYASNPSVVSTNYKNSLDSLLVTPQDAPLRVKAKQELTPIYLRHDHLSQLESIINFVRDSSNDSNPNKAKTALILKQALTCAFGLKGPDIDMQIGNILLDNGTTKGVKSKLQELKSTLDNIDADFFSKENCPLKRTSHSLDGIAPINGLTCSEITDK